MSPSNPISSSVPATSILSSLSNSDKAVAWLGPSPGFGPARAHGLGWKFCKPKPGRNNANYPLPETLIFNDRKLLLIIPEPFSHN